MSMDIKVLRTEHRTFVSKGQAIVAAIRQVPAGATVYGYEVEEVGDPRFVDVIYGIASEPEVVDAPKVVQHPWTERLARTNQRTPIELRASDLVWAIEKMGAHPLLTEAQSLVDRALRTLGAWTDAGEPGKSAGCYMPAVGDMYHVHYVPKD